LSALQGGVEAAIGLGKNLSSPGKEAGAEERGLAPSGEGVQKSGIGHSDPSPNKKGVSGVKGTLTERTQEIK